MLIGIAAGMVGNDGLIGRKGFVIVWKDGSIGGQAGEMVGQERVLFPGECVPVGHGLVTVGKGFVIVRKDPVIPGRDLVIVDP